MSSSTARKLSTQHKVLAFHAPDDRILSAVQNDCQSLRIPTYDEIRGVYLDALNGYYRSRDIAKATWHFQASRDRLAQLLRVAPSVVEPFTPAGRSADRDPDLKAGLLERERQYEAGAYLLGLYVARREYPRLGGGVL